MPSRGMKNKGFWGWVTKWADVLVERVLMVAKALVGIKYKGFLGWVTKWADVLVERILMVAKVVKGSRGGGKGFW